MMTTIEGWNNPEAIQHWTKNALIIIVIQGGLCESVACVWCNYEALGLSYITIWIAELKTIHK